MNENFYTNAVNVLRRSKTETGADGIFFKLERGTEKIEINIYDEKPVHVPNLKMSDEELKKMSEQLKHMAD